MAKPKETSKMQIHIKNIGKIRISGLMERPQSDLEPFDEFGLPPMEEFDVITDSLTEVIGLFETLNSKSHQRKYYYLAMFSKNQSITPITQFIYCREFKDMKDFCMSIISKGKAKKLNIQAFLSDEGLDYLVDYLGDCGKSYSIQ